MIDDKTSEIIKEAIKRKEEPFNKYKPFQYQIDFWNSKKPVQVIKGGNASGKSTISALKVAHLVLKQPKSNITKIFWVITKSYDMHTITWQEKLSQFINPREIESINYINRTKQIPSSVLLKNNILLEFKSWESGDAALTGRSIMGAWFDEPFPEDVFLEVFARTRDEPNAQIICSQTPINHDPFLINKYNERHKDWDWFNWHTKDNTALPEEWYKSFESQIPEDMKDTRLRGAFGSYEGQVYKEFSRNIHVIPYEQVSLQIHRDHQPFLMRSIDLGFSHPFVCLWIYKDGDGCYYVFDEHYKNQTTLEDHVVAINKRQYGNYHKTLCDPADSQVRAELSKLGLPTTEAKKAVSAGIEAVKRQLVIKANGKPNLYITDNCKNMIREMEMYRWLDGIKDAPLKEHDHCCFTADTKIEVPHGKILYQQSQGIKKVYYFMGSWVTADHPILTQRGFISLDKLTKNDIIYLWQHKNTLLSYVTALDFTNQTQTIKAITIGHLIKREFSAIKQNYFMSMYGKNIMASNLQVAILTIKMVINLTMIYLISNALLMPSIVKNIKNKCIQSGKKILLKLLEGKKRIGTIKPPLNTYASCAEFNIQQNKTESSCIVPDTVQTSGVITSLDSKYAEVFAVATTTGWFTANDVVVSNCDPLRYAIFYDTEFAKTNWTQVKHAATTCGIKKYLPNAFQTKKQIM